MQHAEPVARINNAVDHGVTSPEFLLVDRPFQITECDGRGLPDRSLDDDAELENIDLLLTQGCLEFRALESSRSSREL